eukprot:g151.t1
MADLNMVGTSGVILCFAGRYFPYSGFFWRAFILKGWPPIAQAVAQMRQRYAQQTGRAGDGYEFFAKRQLITLFSAPNYCGEFDNAGAMMSIDETLMCSFKVLKPVKGKK